MVTELLIVLWLSQLIVTDAETLHKCRPPSGQKFKITCPRGVIKIHSAEVGFVPDRQHDNDPPQCEVMHPTCAVSIEALYDITKTCSERPACEFSQQVFTHVPCLSPNKKIYRVTYSCIRVFQKCLAHGPQEFGCPDEHVIEIHSVKIGSGDYHDSDTGYSGTDDYSPDPISSDSLQCSLSHGECTWLIDQALLVKCNRQRQCHLTNEDYNYLLRSIGLYYDDAHDYVQVIKVTYSCIIGEFTDKTTTDEVFLSEGAAVGIIVVAGLLLLLVIVLLIIVVCLYRRLRSGNNASNSRVEDAPNAYELSSDRNHQPATVYAQIGSNAPATSTGGDNDITQPSAAPRTSSHNDTTLIDNDLYK